MAGTYDGFLIDGWMGMDGWINGWIDRGMRKWIELKIKYLLRFHL
jgi:hypothetical protein